MLKLGNISCLRLKELEKKVLQSSTHQNAKAKSWASTINSAGGHMSSNARRTFDCCYNVTFPHQKGPNLLVHQQRYLLVILFLYTKEKGQQIALVL